jgi:hypothetical protein
MNSRGKRTVTFSAILKHSAAQFAYISNAYLLNYVLYILSQHLINSADVYDDAFFHNVCSSLSKLFN